MKEGRMCSGGRVSEERGNGGGRYGGGKPEGQAGEEEKKGGIRGSSTDGRRGTETRSGLRTLEVCCHPGKEHNMEMCGPCIGCIWTERDRQLQTAETVMTWWLHETSREIWTRGCGGLTLASKNLFAAELPHLHLQNSSHKARCDPQKDAVFCHN
ncbi:uncharacterized protein GJ701_006899 isoform 4-T4 [Geothlypis trichas]